MGQHPYVLRISEKESMELWKRYFIEDINLANERSRKEKVKTSVTITPEMCDQWRESPLGSEEFITTSFIHSSYKVLSLSNPSFTLSWFNCEKQILFTV